MANEVKLPRLGQGMEAGTVVKWLKSEGDAVEKGEPLYELDTDKVTQEVEAEASGVLLKIAVSEGEVPVGTTLAFIGDEGERVEAEAPTEEAAAAEPQAPPAPAPAPEPEPDLPPAAAVAPADRYGGERIKASPLARRLAREQGIDLAAIAGTGPEGRIVAEDVERATAGAAPAPPPTPAAPAPVEPAPAVTREPVLVGDDVERVTLTSIRRTIARRLTEAWQIPVFQLVLSADMDAVDQVLTRRKELNPEEHVTVTDVLVKVCAAALMRHREVNVQFNEEELLVFPYANVGIAVATDRGLVVPVIRNAEHLSLAEVSAARSDIVKRAREGALRHEDLDGGTFTISNLGMFGLDQFTAVLNPPQAAILAVGASAERAVVREGQIVARPMMTMTLSCDHRAVDGAPAAAFLETVKAMLEDLSLAL